MIIARIACWKAILDWKWTELNWVDGILSNHQLSLKLLTSDWKGSRLELCSWLLPAVEI